MKDTMLKLYIKFQNLLSQEEGQDLVEYALVVAIIALGAVTAMGNLANGIGTAFNAIGSKLAAYPSASA